MIHAAADGDRDDQRHEPFLRARSLLLETGAADGTLKPGLDPGDVLLQLGVLRRIDPSGEGTAGGPDPHPDRGRTAGAVGVGTWAAGRGR
ncbi:hypothetical protein [Streptomyces sp. NPDC005017]|uniref:hypothetical protein n=1 Tax=Streptomyces sp. NPDC005017 TaxID=3364706 RepID=UPI0036C6EC2C